MTPEEMLERMAQAPYGEQYISDSAKKMVKEVIHAALRELVKRRSYKPAWRTPVIDIKAIGQDVLDIVELGLDE